MPSRVRDDERADRLRAEAAALHLGEDLAGHRLGVTPVTELGEKTAEVLARG